MTELPKSWEIKRLADCLEKLKSGKFAERGWSPQCLDYPVQSKGAWGVLKTTSVQMGEYQPEYNKELPDSLDPKIGLEVNPGDFLVTTTGPRNRCGIVCNVKETPKNLIFSGKILRFRANQEIILAKWLMFLLMSPEYQKTLDKLKVGTSDSSVSIGNQQILDLEIPVPPLAEQQEIVELIGDHLSRLDAASADVKLAKIKAAQFRRSILQFAFKRGLDDEQEKSTWTSAQLSDLVDIGWGDLQVTKKSYVESGFLAYSATGADGFLPYFDYDSEGIIVSAIGANCGKIFRASGKWSCIKNTMRILPKSHSVLIDYLFHYLSDSNIFPKRGSGQPFIGQQDAREIEIFFPSISEQKKIVEFVEFSISRLDATMKIAEQMELQAIGLRRSLLHAAFTGQLTKEVVNV